MRSVLETLGDLLPPVSSGSQDQIDELPSLLTLKYLVQPQDAHSHHPSFFLPPPVILKRSICVQLFLHSCGTDYSELPSPNIVLFLHYLWRSFCETKDK